MSHPGRRLRYQGNRIVSSSPAAGNKKPPTEIRRKKIRNPKEELSVFFSDFGFRVFFLREAFSPTQRPGVPLLKSRRLYDGFPFAIESASGKLSSCVKIVWTRSR